jgi:signal transduction histidine kinase
MPLSHYQLDRSKLAIIVTGLLVIVLLGVIDYATGPQISFSVFYLLPISLVTWLTNRQGGIISAIIGAVTWLAADLTSPTIYSHSLIPYWNAVVRLLVFLAIVLLESALKGLNQELDERVKNRTTLLEEEVEERKKIEERLQQHAKRLELLHEIDRAILAAQSLESIASTTILHIQNMIPCDRISFLLFDLKIHQAVLFEGTDENNSAGLLKKPVPMDLFPDFSAEVESLRQNDAWVNNDLLSIPLGSSALQTLLFQNYRSMTLVPILIQDELIGSLNLMAYNPNDFSSEQLVISQEIANQLGIAIQQARMMTQLRSDQENLQSLSQRLLEIQESERRSIARELHDEIGQALTGIGLTLEMATHQQTNSNSTGLKQAHNLVVELMERVSQLSLDLRPALLDDLGLLPTLLWYLDRYESQTNIKATLKHSGLEGKRFAPEAETAAYRIVQEALTNVARHARVKKARVTLWFDQNVLGIQVEDKGNGFNPEAEMSKGNSNGLLGMQERTALLGGNLTIESAIGSGTRLLAEIPMEIYYPKEGELK